jgi:hypothetical protein
MLRNNHFHGGDVEHLAFFDIDYRSVPQMAAARAFSGIVLNCAIRIVNGLKPASRVPFLSTGFFPGFPSKIFRLGFVWAVGGGRLGAVGAVLGQALLEIFQALSQRLVLLLEKSVLDTQKLAGLHYHFESAFKLCQSVTRVPHGHLIYACSLKNRAVEEEILDFLLREEAEIAIRLSLAA